MKTIFLLLSLVLFTSLSYSQTRFKIRHVYQECSACHNTAYDKFYIVENQIYPSTIIKEIAEDRVFMKNYEHKLNVVFSGTIAKQDQAETQCAMTHSDHAWKQKEKIETSTITQADVNKEKTTRARKEKEALDKQREEETNKKEEEKRNAPIVIPEMTPERLSLINTKQKEIDRHNEDPRTSPHELGELYSQLASLSYKSNDFNSAGWYYILAKEYDTAMYYLLEGFKINPTNPLIIGNIINIQTLRGSLEKAYNLIFKIPYMMSEERSKDASSTPPIELEALNNKIRYEGLSTYHEDGSNVWEIIQWRKMIALDMTDFKNKGWSPEYCNEVLIRISNLYDPSGRELYRDWTK